MYYTNTLYDLNSTAKVGRTHTRPKVTKSDVTARAERNTSLQWQLMVGRLHCRRESTVVMIQSQCIASARCAWLTMVVQWRLIQ